MESQGEIATSIDVSTPTYCRAFTTGVVVLPCYGVSKYAHHLMELIENHAFTPMTLYLKTHSEPSSTCPPQIAINYYRDGDPYMFEWKFRPHPVMREFRHPSVDNS